MKKSKGQLIRHIIQLISFILYPGLFIITWNSLGTIYKLLIMGNATFDTFLSPLLIILAIIPITIYGEDSFVHIYVHLVHFRS